MKNDKKNLMKENKLSENSLINKLIKKIDVL